MGFNAKSLPDSFRKCIKPEDRAKRVEFQTSAEALDKQAKREEGKMHDQFIQWCNLNGVFFVYSRMDRRPTVREGMPDFIAIKAGKAVAIEFKWPGQKPSSVQADVLAELFRNGTPAMVSFSVAQAIQFTKQSLGL